MSSAFAHTSRVISGKCYCGLITFKTSAPPQCVAYCHCEDCRRATGGPVAAFAAFDDQTVTFSPNEGREVSLNPGVVRTFCSNCGSSLTGRYDYLPGQVYISLGIIDQANELAPELHAHDGQRLTWLRIEDDTERFASTATAKLSDL